MRYRRASRTCDDSWLAAAAAAIALVPAAAAGSPNVALDDPVYDAIDQRALAGDTPARGGVAPLTETRVSEFVGDGEAAPDGAWPRPIDRGALRVERAAYVAGARRINAVVRAVVVWRPSARAATSGIR
jgi:hypothetical protein